jgi:hypothetical protein
MNPIKFWQIIKDDTKKTFEVCGQEGNTNAFTNKTYAMQKAGMNVSCVTPPVSNKTSSKDLITITGYTREEGLYERLLKAYREKIIQSYQDEDFAD